ncbi:MAG TPA: DUF305 domain-containing protein [Chitinophagaceae bacterium]|nr:DUF305 domain-containing protein [Chitinophagaceae bacterium]
MRTNILVLLFLAGITVLSCNSFNTAAPPEQAGDSAPAVKAEKSENLKAILDSNVTRMSRMPLTNNPTKDFALIMRVHHDGAEKLIKEAMKYNKDSALAKIARDIQKNLDKETVVLNRFIIDHRFKKHEQESPVSNTLMKAMTPNTEPTTPLTGDVEEDFVKLMITNLQSANDLVEVMKDAGADYEVSGFTTEMVPRNEKYIAALREWTSKGDG